MAGGSERGEMRQLLRRMFREQAREPVLTLGLLRQHWPGVVGPELSARTHPQRLDGPTLWIAAPDACWAYELQFFKAELLASVQAFLESRAVTDLRFVAGAHPAPTQAAGAAQPTPPARGGAAQGAPAQPAPAEETPPALAQAAATIGDAALRGVFQRSLAKQRRRRERPGGEPSARPTPEER
jgi:hypothetical protein